MTNVSEMPMAMQSLSTIRKQFGLTQSELADKLRISRQHLSKLENASKPLSPKLIRRLAEVLPELGVSDMRPSALIRLISVLSWAQAGTGVDFEELPFDWQKRIATDCPDEQAFAVEIQGDSMEPKFFQGDIAVLMPTQQPRNGSLVVARLEGQGIVFKVFTTRDRICTFTSYNPVFQPIDVSENIVIWNYPVYQIVRQIWR